MWNARDPHCGTFVACHHFSESLRQIRFKRRESLRANTFQVLPHPARSATLTGKPTEGPLKSIIAVCFVTASLALASDAPEKTVTGWVLDSACAFTKGLTKPISRDCAVSCANKGSQLVILQDDGTIYWPISDQMPAEGQNKRLLPLAGKRVTVTGKLYTRGGSNALVIEKIAETSGK